MKTVKSFVGEDFVKEEVFGDVVEGTSLQK